MQNVFVFWDAKTWLDRGTSAHQNPNTQPSLPGTLARYYHLVCSVSSLSSSPPLSSPSNVFFLFHIPLPHSTSRHPVIPHPIQTHTTTSTSSSKFALIILLTSYCIVITLAIILYLHLRRENKRRDGLPKDDAERDKLAFRDLTDKENIYFRYVL